MARSNVLEASAAGSTDRERQRLPVAREVLAILRRALPADHGLELRLAGDAPTRQVAAAHVVIKGSLDVAQLVLGRPSDSGPAEIPLRPWWHG